MLEFILSLLFPKKSKDIQAKEPSMNLIRMEELNPHNNPVTAEQQTNLNALLVVLNKLRDAYGKPMIITSGLRSEADQARINPSAPKSKHLLGQAADILDVKGEFWAFCMNNLPLMEQLGVYFEDRNSTPTWVHVQITPPRSGKRVFLP